jgi:hypothetical protein
VTPEERPLLRAILLTVSTNPSDENHWPLFTPDEVRLATQFLAGYDRPEAQA